MSRRPKPEIETFLDKLLRSTDPTAEDLARLCFTLETDAAARKAFATRYDAMNRFVRAARSAHLPRRLAEQLERDLPRVKSFAELVAEAERKGDPAPQLELDVFEPGTDEEEQTA